MTLTKTWQLTPQQLFDMGNVVPVLVIHNVDDAIPIAKALLAAGIRVLEVTLRTEAALDVIKVIADELPDAIIGAGTVTNPAQYKAACDAGAKFIISPGLTRELLQAANEGDVALIPGISSISEMMKGLDYGYDHFKFFPAESSGGVKAIKSISGPFPDVRFCPTGGINLNNINDYLALPNVNCCGGSWLVSDKIIAEKDWNAITELAKQAVAHTAK